MNNKKSCCVICGIGRQKTVNGIKQTNVKTKLVGDSLAINLLKDIDILVSPSRLICVNCLINPYYMAEQHKTKYGTWNDQIWVQKYKNKYLYNEMENICLKLVNSKVFKTTNVIQKPKKIISEMLFDILQKTDGILRLKRWYKQYFGLTRDQIKLVLKEVLISFKNDKFGVKIHTTNKYVEYLFDKSDITSIILDLFCLFAKWKMGSSNSTLGVIFQVSHVYFGEQIYRGTALLKRYSYKWLCNTHKKIAKERPDEVLCKIMNIPHGINVINGDGIRFKAQSAQHFHTQQFTYDAKHKYNAYNCIGFNTPKCGKYIGFYPKCGVGSDGHHWDGHVIDFLTFNNVDNHLKMCKKNSKPFANDGTKVIFDKALEQVCVTLEQGILNFSLPKGHNVMKSKFNVFGLTL